MEKLISSKELSKNRIEYDHQFKWFKQALNFNNKEDIDYLFHEINHVNCVDYYDNDKIGFQFRTIETIHNDKKIVDTSIIFEREPNDSLISGATLLSYMNEYQLYVKEHFPHGICEVIFYYYSLDIKNNHHFTNFTNDDFIIDKVIPLKNSKITTKKF